MSENTLDLLMYIVDNILSDQTQIPTNSMISDALSEAGLSPLKIESTINWFEKMVDQNHNMDYCWADEHAENTRIFSVEEQQKLSPECCHFLMQVEQLDMITPSIRERIIDSVMTSDERQITLSQLQWIAALVLANQKPDNQPYDPRAFQALGQYEQRFNKH